MNTLSINPLLENFHSFPPKFQGSIHLKVGKFQFLPNHSIFLQRPISSSSKLFSSRPKNHTLNQTTSEHLPEPKTCFSETSAQRFDIFRFGSSLFLGKFNRNISDSPNLEEIIDTQNGKNGGDLYLKKLGKNPKLGFLKAFAERFAVLLVGSLLFLGRFSSPALAHARNINVSPTLEEKIDTRNLEEKIDTQNGKNDEDLYLKILEENPKNVEALQVLLYAKMRVGKIKEALKYVERLIEVEPDEVEWRLIQALSYELMGQLSKAKRLFKEILEERPLLLRALHGLALVMHKNHEGAAVFEMLNKALAKACHENRVTEEHNIKILIAQMHVIKGDLEGGLKKFQDLVEEDPRDFRPYLCQGIIYSLLDRKKEAEEQFQTYQSLVPHEFPQRGFLDDVMIAAKSESSERLKEEFAAKF